MSAELFALLFKGKTTSDTGTSDIIVAIPA